MRKTLPLLLAALGACAAAEPTVVPQPHLRLAKAGILPGQSIPSERDGLRADDTGPIMWVCPGAEGKHEEKEVFLHKCPSCGESNYFYVDSGENAFRCFACTKLMDSAAVKCPECGRVPPRMRTRPNAK